MFNAADYTTYLTDEAHLHNIGDESIALTPKTPKKDDTSKLETIALEIEPSPKQQQQQHQAHEENIVSQSPLNNKLDYSSQSGGGGQGQLVDNLNQTSSSGGGGKKLAGGSVANMSMAESMDGSFYNGYESTKHVNMLETDNIPVESRPKSAGYVSRTFFYFLFYFVSSISLFYHDHDHDDH
jgi:hypothetical protein